MGKRFDINELKKDYGDKPMGNWLKLKNRWNNFVANLDWKISREISMKKIWKIIELATIFLGLRTLLITTSLTTTGLSDSMATDKYFEY